MPGRYRLSRLAQDDLRDILARSETQFGQEARRRYGALLASAMRDVAEDPGRPGSRTRPELAPGARTYHLVHSRERVAASVRKVGRPRHLLVYRSVAADLIETGRVLDERMDLARHLPEGYGPAGETTPA